MEKSCTKCRVTKPLTEFYRSTSTHDGLRSACKFCMKEATYLYRADNRAARNEKAREWAAANREKVRNSVKKYVDKNRDEVLMKRREKYHANRAVHLEKMKEYKRATRPHHTRKQQERKANKLRATPSWADHRYIQMFYDMASEATELTGVLHHVDHIVPLKSKLVCGLHCEDNLQIMPADENIRKSNRVWPNMP